MSQFGFGSVGPVEVIVSEHDLHWFPVSVRSSLVIAPEEPLTSNWEDRPKERYYSIKGAYVVLRVGKELRLGLPGNRDGKAKHQNPFSTCWSIPDADRVTWRTLPKSQQAVAGVRGR
jgi:hypothetical protein